MSDLTNDNHNANHADLAAAVASLRPLSYRRIAARLDLPASAAGMICDIANGRYDHVSDTRLNDLRRRLGLPVVVTIPAIPCPTCGQLHQVGDCHGQSGAVAIIPAGARIVPPAPPRKRKRYRTMRYPPEWDITPAQARQIISDWLAQQEAQCSAF